MTLEEALNQSSLEVAETTRLDGCTVVVGDDDDNDDGGYNVSFRAGGSPYRIEHAGTIEEVEKLVGENYGWSPREEY